jgi:hypothetical protein
MILGRLTNAIGGMLLDWMTSMQIEREEAAVVDSEVEDVGEDVVGMVDMRMKGGPEMVDGVAEVAEVAEVEG